MPAHPASALGLRAGDRERLSAWVRSSSVRAGLAQRARILLLAADGVSNTEIAERVGVSRPTVIAWRARYERSGVGGLPDVARPGRPRTIDHDKIIAATLKAPPMSLGVTHWSSRLLAAKLKIDNTTVARAWRSYGVQPWRAQTFKFSTDPELVAEVTDVVGLSWRHRRTVLQCVDRAPEGCTGLESLVEKPPLAPVPPTLPASERRASESSRDADKGHDQGSVHPARVPDDTEPRRRGDRRG